MKKHLLILSLALFMLVLSCFSIDSSTEDSPLFYGTCLDTFVIRWGYQDLADRVYDTVQSWRTSPEGVTFKATDVKAGDVLFVRNVEWFFTNMMKDISVPFILVTAGDSYQSVRSSWLQYVSNEKVIRWFTIHPHRLSHPKITPIPLGINQVKEHYQKRAEYTKFFARLRKKPKDRLLYMNFTGGEKPPFRADRGLVYSLFKNKPYCYSTQPKKFDEYMEEMAEFKFALSPRGYGIDCYRTWEALLVGTIPIVKSSQLDPLFKDLPVLIVKEWTDLTEDFLERKYEEICAQRYNIEKLFIEYWADKIDEARKTFLEGMLPKI